MATPPTTRSESPSKTPNINQERDQDEGGSQDPDATPRSDSSSQPLALPIRPASIHPSDGFQQLPEDVRQLYDDLLVVSDTRTGIYPAEIRPQEGTQDAGKQGDKEEEDPFFDYLPLSFLFADRPEVASPQARFALAEFYKLRAIKDVARECQRLRRSEAAWNVRVHGPLLELALSRQRGSVVYENATDARILPSFRPSLFTGEVVPECQMVDFVIAPRLSPELDAAIKKRMAELSMSARSTALAEDQFYVNQTDCPPLAFSPSAVTIVTKGSGGSTEEGRLQLGMLGVGGGTEGPPLPTLPLILVHEHQWWLYFAVDRRSTDDLSHSYQLLTVLGLLSTWVDTIFRGWTTDTFAHQLDVWHPTIRGSRPLWRSVPGNSDDAG
ncbi:hypothetical protein B0T18DRAFT_479502 [Schizothecium vesticola]|uniref:PD-(D/E)XK nuclease-like domain-containing protein n=1 Tax=Schizothecium vesticola TaxID=314040 RepID=A0AA40F1V6_9PEZI|nr:hypothetical protein B0T18DRAFT_479502 [Schizothecium vesticola]